MGVAKRARKAFLLVTFTKLEKIKFSHLKEKRNSEDFGIQILYSEEKRLYILLSVPIFIFHFHLKNYYTIFKNNYKVIKCLNLFKCFSLSF